jgi:hypothetical protein
MSPVEARVDDLECARALVEELLRTGFTLIDLISSLSEDLPEDAYPGEEPAAVLIEMVAGSCLPAVEAVGRPGCRAATELAETVRDRVLTDLRAAAELASWGGSPGTAG